MNPGHCLGFFIITAYNVIESTRFQNASAPLSLLHESIDTKSNKSQCNN